MDSETGVQLDLSRHRKVRNYFLRVFLHVLWWDVILNRRGLRIFRSDQLSRWQKLAVEFREIALQLGGVLIKLGQFLSVRLDVLPPEVIKELAGLQDKVPAAPLQPVIDQIEDDFGRPISELFENFSPDPIGAASLAQVHAATTSEGDEVAVKVLRPGIQVLVESDLAALTQAIRWLKIYKPINSRVDLDSLSNEFAQVTRAELDFHSEGKNAERFAEQFVDNDAVYVPRIYWPYSSNRTLTMEHVGNIKIDDLDALNKHGIDSADVAKALFETYMEQIFVTNFVHVDPHAGNLFIKPGGSSTQPFQIVFIDFGMMAVVPEELRKSMREYVIGIGTQDARRVVQAYKSAGVLLPHGDLARIEEATADMLRRFSGVRMGDMREMAITEARYFMDEYRDLVYEAPIQFPVDLLFIFRAIGMLAGVTTAMDPDFSPFSEAIPFATRLAAGTDFGSQPDLSNAIADGARQLLGIPFRMEQLLARVEDGSLGITANLSPEAKRGLRHVERSNKSLAVAVAGAGLMIAGSQLLAAGHLATLGWLMVGSSLIFVLRMRRLL